MTVGEMMGGGGTSVKLFILAMFFIGTAISATLLAACLQTLVAKRSQIFKKALFVLVALAVFADIAFAMGKCFGGWGNGTLLSLAITPPILFLMYRVYEDDGKMMPRQYGSLVDRETIKEEAHKPTRKGMFLGLLCAALPASALGAAYFSGRSTRECFAALFLGFMAAISVLAFGIWRMSKKEKS